MNGIPSRVRVAAGLDPSAGAGLLADAQAVQACGAGLEGVVTALTVQDRGRFHRFEPVDEALVQAQWRALHKPGERVVCKLGMTGGAALLDWLLRAIDEADQPLVLDPVWRASSGTLLADENWRAVLLKQAGVVDLLTPNLDEVNWLLQDVVDDGDRAAKLLLQQGFVRVLIKGGHQSGRWLCDRFYIDGSRVASWCWPALPGSYRGTGCRLASAIAGWYAMGLDWQQAVDRALHWLHAWLPEHGIKV